MGLIDEKITAYAEAYSTPAGRLLDEIEAYTKTTVAMPQMLSGHLQGRMLAFLSRLITPRRILEIGTYTGYSALCLCEGLDPKGKLITVDINADLAPKVRQFFAASPWAQQIIYQIGDARTLVPQAASPLDLVFVDADKANYSLYYDMSMEKLRSGGLLVADNVLWGGKVLDLTQHTDKETHALDAFNKHVQADGRVENLLLPVRDGLMVVRKK